MAQKEHICHSAAHKMATKAIASIEIRPTSLSPYVYCGEKRFSKTNSISEIVHTV